MPNTVVDVDTVNLFKSRLDKFRKHQEVKYDYPAEQLEPETNLSIIIKVY